MSVAFDRPTTLRRTIGGLVFVGIAGYAVLIALGREFAAVVVWVAALVGATLLRRRSSVALFDERDQTIQRRAAALTLAVVGVASAVVFPSLAVASGVGVFEWGTWSTAAAVFVTGLYLSYGGAVVLTARRR